MMVNPESYLQNCRSKNDVHRYRCAGNFSDDQNFCTAWQKKKSLLGLKNILKRMIEHVKQSTNAKKNVNNFYVKIF